MGGFVLLREPADRRRRPTLVDPAATLQLDPRLIDMMDRLGNRGLLRLWHDQDPTPGTTPPAPTPTDSGPEPASAPLEQAPANTPEPASPPAASETPKPVAPSIVTSSDLRAPAFLGLGNPLTNYLYNAADYSFAARGLGAAFDQVRNPYLSGLLDLALTYPLFRWRQYLHEGGHYRADVFAGAHPTIDFPLFGRPSTDPHAVLAPRDKALSSGAGMTQSQLNAMYLYSDWARNGVARPMEIIAYLLAGSDIWTYTLYRGLLTTPGLLDDPFSYISKLDEFKKSGLLPHSMTMKDLFWLSFAAQALSGGTWSSGKGLYRMLAHGDRRLEMLTPRIGGLSFTLPDYHVLLGAEGPIVGAQTLLSPRSAHPFEAHLEVQPLDFGMAAGAKTFDLPIPGLSSWHWNPFVDLSASPAGLGARVGTDLVIPLGPLILTGTAAYSTDKYLLNDVMSTKGWFGAARLGTRFW